MSLKFSSNFITIAGNIGVGKSTLTTLLAHHLGWKPFLEGEANNPYLPKFYEDMQRWSFHSQIFFLSQRLLQHQQLLQNDGSVLQDRSVYEDAEIFARNLYLQSHMSQQDWQTYYLLYQTLSQLLRPPDLVVYLKASVPTLQRRISQRGRHYEQQIAQTYLEHLNHLYEEWVDGFKLCPILTVDTDNLDYVQHDDHLRLIVDRIQERLHGQDYLALGD
ncbi:MAG: deoxynucleoside kinase [Ardenticatenaceae bacterium]|nr:deoxynucleoside kinase [Ardenticatenaceae bacterium]MCB9443314.1 deoxynucleoside kinase [Ardenticatenaceae bacterium]